MATTVKQSNLGKTTQKVASQPKRLSKVGRWMRDNPGGIIKVIDRRAVNR
jgi:hypothetical protein